jgi:outer membrane immunogenic protein
VGWTAGGGFEYALGRNWSVKVEYLYVNLGSVSVAGTVSVPAAGVGYSNGLGVTADLTAHVARAASISGSDPLSPVCTALASFVR